jgi:hypothetical protein
LNGIQQRRVQKKMKEYLWNLAVWSLAAGISTVALCVRLARYLKRTFGSGQAGRLHPNGNFPFVHRESFVGLVRHRFRVLQSLSANHICERSIVGFGKRYSGKD